MVSIEYTSSELSELASTAPTNTLEEDIEAMCQRDIAAFQREFYEKVHQYIDGVDDAIATAMQKYGLDEETAKDQVWKLLDSRFAEMRKELNMAIGALYALRDERIANLLSD